MHNNLFVIGSFDQFARHEALSNLKSEILRGDVASKMLGIERPETVPKAAYDIYTHLSQQQNPIIPSTTERLESYTRHLDYYDNTRPMDSFDMHRAVDIAQKSTDSPIRRFELDIRDQLYEALDNTRALLLNKVYNETQAIVSEVSMQAVFSAGSGKTVTLGHVLDSFNERVSQELSVARELQQKAKIDLLAMHSVKDGVLTDFSERNIEFLSKYGAELSKSDLSISSLASLDFHMQMNGDSHLKPESLANIQQASLSLFQKQDGQVLTGFDLPRSTFEVTQLLQREGVSTIAPDFQAELLNARVGMTGMNFDITINKEMREALDRKASTSQDVSGPSL